MSVRLDDSRRLCKVLVTSQTTGQDVIELLKPDDDNVYSLVEVWKGCGKEDYTYETLVSATTSSSETLVWCKISNCEVFCLCNLLKMQKILHLACTTIKTHIL